VPNMLCSKCRSIVSSSRLLNGQSDQVRISKTPADSVQLSERLESFQHYSTYEELENSCAAQCHLCHLLWDILDDEKFDQVEKDSRATGSSVVVQVRTTTHESKAIQINVALQRLVRRRIEDNYDRCIIARQYPLDTEDDEGHLETILLKTEHPAQLTTSTASNATFDLASQWMTTCLETHKVCEDASSEGIMLPSRLIWLGPSKFRLRPRLCLTTDLNTVPPYFTLSHCWGEAKVTRLTRQVQRESKAIPLDGLPKTFRDAMIVTKQDLGIWNHLGVVVNWLLGDYRRSWGSCWGPVKSTCRKLLGKHLGELLGACRKHLGEHLGKLLGACRKPLRRLLGKQCFVRDL
jgi:hypothetical protein